jgi:hypothetical protein
VIGLATALSSCGAPARTPPPPANTARADFFPLEPGTLWVYQVRDARGEVTLQRVVVKGTIYLESRKTTVIVVEESGGLGGELALDVDWHPVAYYRRGHFVYKLSGLTYAGSDLREMHLGRGEEKVLPADPKTLRSWDSAFQIFGADPDAYEMRAMSRARIVDRAVRVPGGVFRHCVRVDTDTSTVSGGASRRRRATLFHYVDWYAEGIGLVKSLVLDPAGRREVAAIELVSYRRGSGR